MKFCVARTFLVERQLGVVLVVLLVDKIFFFIKLADKYNRKILRNRMIALYMAEISNFFNFGKRRRRKRVIEVYLKINWQ